MKDSIIEIKENGTTYFEFVSKNGIHYDLLHGVTVGRRGKPFSTDTVFIMLDCICEDEEIWNEFIELMGGCSEKFINFFQSSFLATGAEEELKGDEEYIRKSVDKFESENAELISFLINNNIN